MQDKGFDKANLFKSSKKLKFEMQEQKDGDQTNVTSSANTSFHEVLPFNLPSGNETGIHSFNQNANVNYSGFLNNRNLNSLFETVDEQMTEEDKQSVVSSSMISSDNHSSYKGNLF